MDASSANRSFLTRTFARSDDNSNFDSEDSKGPFGLNTLSEPPEPVVADLVFVHGLGGGSRSTWTKSLNPSLFWPEKWLPQDGGFKDVRIHTFGYNSNVGRQHSQYPRLCESAVGVNTRLSCYSATVQSKCCVSAATVDPPHQREAIIGITFNLFWSSFSRFLGFAILMH